MHNLSSDRWQGSRLWTNLKGWASNQSLEATIRAIAEPSAGIALGYNGTEVILKDGGIIHGITFNNSDSYIKKMPLHLSFNLLEE